MVEKRESFDRRSYLKATGAGIAGISLTGFAGCLEDADDGDDDDETGADDDDGAGDDENEIVAGTAPGFEPFEMVIDGELVGFDIDLLEAVVDETEYELADWQEIEFDGLIPSLENENIDVIAAAMTITEDRQETIAFSDPYYSADQTVLVQEGGDVQPDELEDLEGHNVGAQSGTTGEGIVEDELIAEGLIDDGDYDSYDNYVLAVEELERGTLDAIVIDEPVAESFAADRDVEIAFTFETGEEYGFGVRQEDDDLQQALSEGIEAVQESSEYDEITQEWFDE
ncbi:basic amino acid ABC transporter substrate-binding protein [Natronobacterium texcoconense]|uniref:Amino acid ABC transporter substrate-binding protein, PAAT family n=1 Tax=Natronobacterium texcoconense TaxID=1095778 RepID=A0A1H1J0Z6_NATTX|nr:basic amino acid ABC transporter substrate-binding protein [Natronobacterium texcoconense]SDR43657.1 amino acid ABC transporter substrate-binding protein, PAAT family [Natronobacterium texcoconense]